MANKHILHAGKFLEEISHDQDWVFFYIVWCVCI